MDLEGYSVSELVQLYSQTIKELKKRGVLRTKNVVGEIGEYLVLEHYLKNPDLPNLNSAPVGTKNINAISTAGERYTIKSTSGNVTGVFYGLQTPNSNEPDKQTFEYVVICKLNEDYELEGIYELSWKNFLNHKRWHSRMLAWNLTLTKSLKRNARIIFELQATEESNVLQRDISAVKPDFVGDLINESAEFDNDPVTSWSKTKKVDLSVLKRKVVMNLQEKLNCSWIKLSSSRYESENKQTALFIMAANYSERNNEYWYSINDENLPWFDLYKTCYLAFVMGESDKVLLFDYRTFKSILNSCLRTEEDVSKKNKPHYHIHFTVEGNNTVYFKKKIPEKDFVNVSDALL